MNKKAQEQHLNELLGVKKATQTRRGIAALTDRLTRRGLTHKAAVPMAVAQKPVTRKATLTTDPREALETLLGMIDDESIPAVIGYVASMMTGHDEPDGDEELKADELMSDAADEPEAPEGYDEEEKAFGDEPDGDEEEEPDMTTKSLALLTKGMSDLTRAIQAISANSDSQFEALSAKVAKMEKRMGAPARAASQAPETVVNDQQLTAVAKNLNEQYEQFGAIMLRKG